MLVEDPRIQETPPPPDIDLALETLHESIVKDLAPEPSRYTRPPSDFALLSAIVVL
jgi:hypothetical protein